MPSFEWAYAGVPPWDIGRPQPELVRLAEEGEIEGAVLDVGCGTGENALFLASRGHETVGIDSAPTAIARAEAKAARRGLAAAFIVGDALELHRLGRTFDTAVDSGLFHLFADEERPRFVASLAATLRPGGTFHLLCFSELEMREGGPRRVTREEIRDSFRDGWVVARIRPARFESQVHEGGARAWLATIHRMPPPT